MADQEIIRITNEAALKDAGIDFTSVGALRWQAQQAKQPGHPFHRAFVRIGRAVYLDPRVYHAAARGQKVEAEPSVKRGPTEEAHNPAISRAAAAAARHGMRLWGSGGVIKAARVVAMSQVVLEFPSWGDAAEYLESVAPRPRRVSKVQPSAEA